ADPEADALAAAQRQQRQARKRARVAQREQLAARHQLVGDRQQPLTGSGGGRNSNAIGSDDGAAQGATSPGASASALTNTPPTTATTTTTIPPKRPLETETDLVGDGAPLSKRPMTDGHASSQPVASSSSSSSPPPPPPPPSQPAILRLPAPQWTPCSGSVDDYERLNRIEEGTYGLVSRARHKASGLIVALKKLKMEVRRDGFPVTGLREIQTLMQSRHENVLHLQRVVVGDQLGEVYLVMDFVEHDLKMLLQDMQDAFLPSELKTITHQILAGVSYLHSCWIMHRDLKTSNILMSNRGVVKLADFGMARFFADPPPRLTRLVVTLWYRAPELLLGESDYGPAIDIWSVGCILGELLLCEPLLCAKTEAAQISAIFDLTGYPTATSWPAFQSLPQAKALSPPPQAAAQPPTTTTSSPALPAGVPLLPAARFPRYLTEAGLALISRMLALNPAVRITADEALRDSWFTEDPKPKPRDMFPTFPSRAKGMRRLEGAGAESRAKRAGTGRDAGQPSGSLA
ncbi:hypothetical protein KEM52_006118, partial [Ascosphaera acerosa]